MLATDLLLALDPVHLARRCGLELDRWQRDVLTSSARQIILNCSRQSGKSTVAALLAVDTALSVLGALVLLVAPAQRQAVELYRKCRMAVAALGAHAPPTRQESALSLEFMGGSRITVIPGDERTVRGFSAVSLLVVDEASRVMDDLYQALRPMLAVSGGRVVLLSTPAGARGFFHHEWTNGGQDWKAVKITAHECPRIDPAWLKAERRAIGERWFRQEYEGSFESAVDAVFRPEDVRAILSDEVTPLRFRGAA
jgi:hypothetical protein